jgi:hypothetical protein
VKVILLSMHSVVEIRTTKYHRLVSRNKTRLRQGAVCLRAAYQHISYGTQLSTYGTYLCEVATFRQLARNARAGPLRTGYHQELWSFASGAPDTLNYNLKLKSAISEWDLFTTAATNVTTKDQTRLLQPFHRSLLSATI